MLYPVSDTPAISTLLAGGLLKPGDEVVLAPGVYASFMFKGRHFASPGILIRAADPLKPPTVQGMELNQSDGFSFADLDFITSSRTGSVAWIIECDRVTVNASKARVPATKQEGFRIRTSTHVTINGTDFSGTSTAVIILGSSNVAVMNSTFHDLYGDAIQTTNSSYVTLAGNRFTDFYPQAGSHPDAMQFFTTGQTAAAGNITISKNVVVRGNGGIVQGAFMGDEAHVGYKNVTITGNAFVGCMYNGIAISNGQAVNIADNLVQPFTDMGSWIQINGGTGVAPSNAAVQVVAPAGVSVTGTIPIKAVAVGDLATLQAWLKAHGMAPWGSATAPTPVPPTPTPPVPAPPPPTPVPTDWQAIAEKALADDAADKAEITRLNTALTAEQLQEQQTAQAAAAQAAQDAATIAALQSQLRSAASIHALVVADRDDDRRLMLVAQDAITTALGSLAPA